MTRPTVVLVEDNPDDEALAHRAFRKAEIETDIVVARNGQEAVDLLLGAEARNLRPTIVLLDLKLPMIGGLEVLRRLREDPTTRKLPIIVLTTSSEEEDVETSYHLGANSFIRKPVNWDDFLEAIRLIGKYWLRLNVPPPT